MIILRSSFSRHKRNLILLLTVFVEISVSGQNTISGALTAASSDVAETRRKAEAGDADAQVAFGNILTSHWRHADALLWYRRAAIQGNPAGQARLGRTLLYGALGNPNDQTVQAEPLHGLRWTFMAATNHDQGACWDMSNALQRGLGTDVDLIAAYAWLKLSSESWPGGAGDRIELNDLALKMNTADVQRAQILASQFRAGQWQLPVARIVPDGDSRLKLTGITAIGPKNSFAVISGKVVSEGELATIPLKPIPLRLKCLRISMDSVLILVDGEDRPRLLRLSR